MAEIGGRAGQTYILLTRFIGASAEDRQFEGRFSS